MTKLALVGCVFLALAASLCANELPPRIGVVKPPFVKIRVEDTGSRLLSQEEAAKLAPQDQVVAAENIAKPLVDIQPAVKVEQKPVDQAPAVVVDPMPANDEKLPPIEPLIPQLPVPSFIQSILNSIPRFGQNPSDMSSSLSSDDSGDNAQPRKIISILVMKHGRTEEQTGDQSQPGQVGGAETMPIKSSFFIFKFLPRLRNGNDNANNLGGETDPDNKLFRMPLLGGETDPDNKMARMPLLGGGGENDPDRLRFKFNPIFTGNDDLIMNNKMPKDNDDDDNDDDDDDDNNSDEGNNNDPENKSDGPSSGRPVSIFSLIDRVKNFFKINNPFLRSDSANGMPPQSIIIRTDDGQTALLPNEFNYGNDIKSAPSEDPNKCLMLSFMRLKASMYYRTILHLLFFSGVLLFVLFMVLLTVKSYKKRKYTTLRYTPHNMSVSTIDGNGKDVKSCKFKFLRSWTGSDSQLITSPDVKSVLINAPPSYDQVPYTKIQDVDTKSLPPDYDDNEAAAGAGDKSQDKSDPKV